MTDPYGRDQIPDPPLKRPRFNWPKWLAVGWLSALCGIGVYAAPRFMLAAVAVAAALAGIAVLVFSIAWVLDIDGCRSRWEKRNGFREE